MKKPYESPDFDCLKFAFEETLQTIEYSKNEDYQHSGDEGDDDIVP